MALPSPIFDFEPSTSPSWSPKVNVLGRRTPYSYSYSPKHPPRHLTHPTPIIRYYE